MLRSWHSRPSLSVRGTSTRRSLRAECLENRSLLTDLAGLAQPPATEQGEWPQFRGDPQLSGRSPLVGNITEPEIQWEYDIGHVDRYFELLLNGSNNEPSVLDNVDQFDDYWQRQGMLFDLDGDGTLTPIEPSLQTKIGDFLPDSPGLEMVRFIVTHDNGISLTSVGQLLRREAGEWIEVWQSDPIDNLYQAKPIVGDFDADGSLEVAVVPHQNLLVFDLATGQLEQQINFMAQGASSPRSYGWFGARDLNADGRQEFVLLGDFENFVSVIGWQNGELTRLWDHSIEAGIANKQTIHRPLFDPFADINGDGQLELVTNIFNDHHSNRWEAVVYDGLTGQSITRLANRIATAAVDIDSDGSSELFLRNVHPLVSTAVSSVEVVTFAHNKPQSIWSSANVSFVETIAAEVPLEVNSAAATGRTHMTFLSNSNDTTAFVTQGVDSVAGTTELTVWRYDDVLGFVLTGNVSGGAFEIIAARSDSLLLRETPFGPPTGPLNANGVSVDEQHWSTRATGPLTTPIIGRQAVTHDRPTLVVQGSGLRMHALRLDNTGRPVPVWDVAGRGVYTGSALHTGFDGFAGPIMADLLGNGTRQTVLATTGSQGQAVLKAIDAHGSTIWSLPFNSLPGAPPQWNIGGLTTWVAGRFRDVGHDDLLVSIRRSTMHSDELRLVDGSNGEVLWTRTTAYDPGAAGDVRGAGGNWLALIDYDGDGLDEAVNFYPDVFTVIDGDGTNLVQHSFNHELFPGRQSLYSTPVIADFLGNGTLTVYYAASAFETGLFQLDGTPVWRGAWRGGSPGIVPAIGDFDGNGSLEIVSVGQRGENGRSTARAVDAATGEILWSLDLPGTPFNANGGSTVSSPLPPVVADIDGDGREEAIFPVHDMLYSLGFSPEDQALTIEWQLRFDAKLGAPALADLYGYAPLQIIVTTIDGKVHGVGQPLIVSQNADNRFDVDANESVTLSDVLHIVARLRRYTPSADSMFVDVNGDGSLTLTDALELIAELRLTVR